MISTFRRRGSEAMGIPLLLSYIRKLHIINYLELYLIPTGRYLHARKQARSSTPC